jgi:hypothetical protein
MPEYESQEMFELLWAHIDRRISATDAARLNDLLQTSREARATYIQFIEMTASLSWKASVNREDRVLAELGHKADAAEQGRVRVKSPVIGMLRTTFRGMVNSPVVTTLFVATLIYGTFTYLAWDLRSNKVSTASLSPNDNSSVAIVRDSQGTHWSSDTAAMSDDSPIRQGELLKIDSGLIHLNLKRGVDLLVEGPAEWSIDSENSATLHAGKLVAMVPARAVGFVLETPSSQIVDLGTEFGVEVNAGSGTTEVHVLRGTVETTRHTKESSGVDAKPIRLKAGSAIRISPDKESDERIAFDNKKFAVRQAISVADPSVDESTVAHVIPLGNLFDDPRGTPLAKAIESDEFRAVGEVGDLAIHRIFYGGDAAKLINPHVLFDARTLGWNGARHTSITNDAWCESADFGEEDGTPGGGGIQTLGTRIQSNVPKIEDGIGMHANALITFDLEKIRSAGKFDGRRLEFICDRAGINDNRIGKNRGASVHMAVLLSDAVRVRTALVDGQDSQLTEKAGIWSVAAPIGKPLRADGRFCSFRIVIPPDVRYLTLLAACADEDYFADHAVWSGARLEVAE